QRIDADLFAAEDFRKLPARGQADLMAIRKHDLGVGMDLTIGKPRHAMVHAAGYLADFRMQRAAEGDVHLLQAAADAEQRHTAFDTGLREPKSDLVAMDVIGLVLDVRRGVEARRMDVGARAAQYDAL